MTSWVWMGQFLVESWEQLLLFVQSERNSGCKMWVWLFQGFVRYYLQRIVNVLLRFPEKSARSASRSPSANQAHWKWTAGASNSIKKKKKQAEGQFWLSRKNNITVLSDNWILNWIFSVHNNINTVFSLSFFIVTCWRPNKYHFKNPMRCPEPYF